MRIFHFLINIKLTLPALFFISVAISEVHAQPADREIVTQATEWFALNSNIKLHKKFGFAFDSQLRFVQDFESAQNYIRIGPEIYLTPKLSFVPAGYMYVWNFQYGKQPSTYVNNEQRIWQQILYKHNLRKFFFNHRFRMEERFIQKHYTDQAGELVYEGYDTYANRIRYRLQIQFPLNKPKVEAAAWFITVYDEVFYSWGKPVTYHKPDQNRIYAAIGYQFSSKFSVQGGPFYQMLIKKNGAQQENNVGALVQFGYNFDFSKQN
jgi:Protein of unknown function (DUF2490)